VLELRIKSENCERLEENLLKALKELNRRVKEKVKEKAQNSLLGSLGLF
jgi:DNA-binding protein YbaB